LFRVDLPGRAVLGMFADSREQEVVVNPDFLRGRIELVDEFSESAESAERRVRLAGVFGIDPVRLIPGSTTGGRHADGRN
jgi:hypothetical protein